MSDKPEDKYIDDLFRDSINNVETQPSDQFWNKAYDSILQNENTVYEKRIKRLRTVSVLLALAVAGLIGYNVYTGKKVTNIEQKIAVLEKNQLQTANNESRSVDALASNTLNGNQPASGTSQQPLAQNNTPVVQSNAGVAANSSSRLTNNVGTGQNRLASANGYVRSSSSIVAYNNVSAQRRVSDKSAKAGISNMIYLEDKSAITIPPPDRSSDSALLAMDVEDNVSTVKPIAEEENNVPAPAKIKFLHRLSVSAYVAPSLGNPVIKANENSDNINISPADVKSREQEKYGYIAGANIGYDVSSRFTVELGAEYSSYNYSLSPTTVNVNTGEMNSGYPYVTSSGVVYMPYIPGYTPFGYYDTVATAKGNANRSYLSIPLRFKYYVIDKPKLGIYLTAGASMNILLSNYATVHCQNSWGEEDVYLYGIDGAKTVNFSYLIGVGAKYELGRHFALYAEPYYSAAITTNTSSSVPITTYFNYFDVALGVNYHF